MYTASLLTVVDATNVRPEDRKAPREYALGLEALHRFVTNEPLHRVHECAFGILALESTPVDSRL